MAAQRRSVELSYVDEVNAWRTTRMAASAQLEGEIHGYADYWERTGGFTVRRELPHAEGVLIVNFADPIEITGGDGCAIRLLAGEAFVAGVHTRSALSHSTGTQAGIHVFLPLATVRRLLGVPMDELVDRVVPLDALLGRSARELGDALGDARGANSRAEILDQVLEMALARATPLDRRLTHALAVLRERPDRDIARVADDVGWSRKHLAARVRDAVGVGPRSFRRLLRFQTLTGLIGAAAGRPDWAALALEAGYYDQSHMIREFGEFSGLTPGTYLARALPNGGGLVEA
ncbi:helix-turn-helix domain-containing protein [Sphingomonas radiodurans]|uniref:helix-turn-helix domain-containing protein n=1 Tax=Sphingomonas radiodurans TaxID=2890321 RepID=UPI001E5D8EA6|nr:helix-turn-helix domain-containing protein [Sphingomonas radiodurans]WBH14994.1 helix-turn-helix domain-containing protein [Sphingomonas radiodurans]